MRIPNFVALILNFRISVTNIQLTPLTSFNFSPAVGPKHVVFPIKGFLTKTVVL
jgi:hypothetical protein